jgi:hypothetical protein
LLKSDTISVTLNNGSGTLYYSFETTVETNITYEIKDDMFIMICEDEVDLMNDGNAKHKFDLPIVVEDGVTYFVMIGTLGNSDFYYYVTIQK